ncbi:hypothetical protein EDD66_103137 [Mobilisporobacter senegalensis]|uniref:Uncharacterized protein n=1 Tax=Mobilisporobacter senegalensis TaxID=1329262 RepID=A0A3N1XVJ1_9FIRM|nr:hypothetical protein EDD66_103137 [Mobilisporobacter senegalensis]
MIMAQLFDNNFIFVYFFAIITIFNYSCLKEFQKIVIIYITVFSLG